MGNARVDVTPHIVLFTVQSVTITMCYFSSSIMLPLIKMSNISAFLQLQAVSIDKRDLSLQERNLSLKFKIYTCICL